jgi:hypothetical protein
MTEIIKFFDLLQGVISPHGSPALMSLHNQ